MIRNQSRFIFSLIVLSMAIGQQLDATLLSDILKSQITAFETEAKGSFLNKFKNTIATYEQEIATYNGSANDYIKGDADKKIDSEEKSIEDSTRMCHEVLRQIPNESFDLTSAENPHETNTTEETVDVSTYYKALYAYIFATEDDFNKESKKLSKDDQSTIEHYKNLFNILRNTFINDVDLQATNLTPFALQCLLIKNSAKELIDYLESTIDPAAPTVFEGKSLDSLYILSKKSISEYLPVSAIAQALSSSELVIEYITKDMDQGEKDRLTPFYNKNTIALYLQLFINEFDQEERQALAKVIKRFNFEKVFNSDKNSALTFLDAVRATCAADELTLSRICMKISNIGISLGCKNFEGTPFEDVLIKTKDSFAKKMEQYTKASKKTFTNKKEFQKQSFFYHLEDFITNEVPTIITDEMLEFIKKTANGADLNAIKRLMSHQYLGLQLLNTTQCKKNIDQEEEKLLTQYVKDPKIRRFIPRGMLQKILLNDEATWVNMIKKDIQKALNPFVKIFCTPLSEASWKNAQKSLIYEDYNALKSPLCKENDLPTYIELYYDIKNKKLINQDLIDKYDALKWNPEIDLSIALKESAGSALNTIEAAHKEHWMTIPNIFRKNPLPYDQYIKNLKTFCQNSNPKILTKDVYTITIEKIKQSKFQSFLYKDAVKLTEQEEKLLRQTLDIQLKEYAELFPDENLLKLKSALSKEIKSYTAEERAVFDQYLIFAKKRIAQLSEKQEAAIKAFDLLKSLEDEASKEEKNLITFITNREILLKKNADIALTSREAHIYASLIEKQTVTPLKPHEDITFLNAYNAAHSQMKKEEILRREQYRIIKQNIYKNNVDLLQYRLSEYNLLDFLEEPVFITSALIGNAIKSKPTALPFGISLPEPLKLFPPLYNICEQVLKQGGLLRENIATSVDQQLTEILITNITSPTFQAAKQDAIKELAQNQAKSATFFKDLIAQYKAARTAANPYEEELSFAQAELFISAQDMIEDPSLQIISFFTKELAPENTVKNGDDLYAQLPFINTFSKMLDSLPARFADTFLGGKLKMANDSIHSALSTISDLQTENEPATTDLKEYLDLTLQPDQPSSVKEEYKLKEQKKNAEALKKEMIRKELNKTLQKIKDDQYAKEQNNRLLLKLPIPLTQDVSLGITPYDLRNLGYSAGELLLNTKIDNLVMNDKTQILVKSLLNDKKLSSLIDNTDFETREKLSNYQGKSTQQCPASIIDDRPSERIQSPLSYLPSFLVPSFLSKKGGVKEKKEQSMHLKAAKYNPSTINKLRAHLEGSQTQSGVLTPFINNPSQRSILTSIALKEAIARFSSSLKEKAVGELTWLRTYENVQGSLRPKKDKIILTPSNIDATTVLATTILPKHVKAATEAYHEGAEAMKYAPQVLANIEKTTGQKISLPNISGIGKSIFDVLKKMTPQELKILNSGNQFLFSEYSSAVVLRLFGTFFEYIFYDKISSKALSIYLQKNLNTLDSFIKEYAKAKKNKDAFTLKKIERKFEKFISKSEIAFSDRSLIIKLLPRFFLFINLFSRIAGHVFGNGQNDFFYHLIINPILNGMEIKEDSKKMVYGGAVTATLGAIGFSLWKSIKMIHETYYN